MAGPPTAGWGGWVRLPDGTWQAPAPTPPSRIRRSAWDWLRSVPVWAIGLGAVVIAIVVVAALTSSPDDKTKATTTTELREAQRKAAGSRHHETATEKRPATT